MLCLATNLFSGDMGWKGNPSVVNLMVSFYKELSYWGTTVVSPAGKISLLIDFEKESHMLASRLPNGSFVVNAVVAVV